MCSARKVAHVARTSAEKGAMRTMQHQLMRNQQWEYCILDYHEPQNISARHSEQPRALGTWVASSCLSKEAEEQMLCDPAGRYDIALARLGEDGWELACSFQSPYAYSGDPVLIFKRPKTLD
jgi:hypothetical protein